MVLPAFAHAGPALDSLSAWAVASPASIAVPAATPSFSVLAQPSHPVDPRASQVAQSVWETMLSGMTPLRAKEMRERVRIFIVPRDTRLIDEVVAVYRRELPPAEVDAAVTHIQESYHVRLQQTGDRTAAEPRGVTIAVDSKDGPCVFTFAGEENLIAGGDWDEHGSRERRVLVHELGHATIDATGSKTEWQTAAANAKAYWSDYQSDDDGEIFAISTEIWFGRHQTGMFQAGMTAAAAAASPKLAEMMRMMSEVYGPSREVR
jgi:hypothetical protein